MNPADIPLPHPGIILTDEFDDFPVIFHPLTGEAMGLNETGMQIWGLIDGNRSVGDVITEFSRVFDPAGGTPAEDAEKFIARLHRRMFISWPHETSWEKGV